MFTFDSGALEYIWEGLASGFRRTPQEILLFVFLLAGFLSLLVAIYFFQRIWRGILRRKRTAALFRSVAEEKQLSQQERRTLQDMARTLPGWRQFLGQLGADLHTFNRAAGRYLQRSPQKGGAVAALRLKLGFNGFEGERIIHSSAELEEGMKVYLRKDGKHSYPGKVSAQNPDSVVLRLNGNGDRPVEGDRLQIYFVRKNGVSCFTTRVKQAFGDLLHVEHSEAIARVQRRKFYRGRVSLPVSVKTAGSTRPVLRTYILELGGGGLTLFNPHKVFHAGVEITMSFSLPGGSALRVEARVQRTDRGGSLAHVQFRGIREVERDRILGFVMNRAMRSG
jgi:hypothetical protein